MMMLKILILIKILKQKSLNNNLSSTSPIWRSTCDYLRIRADTMGLTKDYKELRDA